MKHYGIPYKGSKDKIAPTLIRELPVGERFVDLFGGGFAMSHCALLSGKYEKVLYNELDRNLVELIRDAIAGKYNYKVFKPKFITRAEFEKKKEQDAYIKYIWSFANAGDGYLFGKDIEPLKKLGHDYVIFKKSFWGFPVIGENEKARRINLRKIVKARVKNRSQRKELERVQQLEQLERLERLEQLEQLQELTQLERLELTCGSYEQYKYRKGDVVYCDPPYENTSGYTSAFDTKAFYDWVASRKFQVFFSSYKISDTRFKMIYAKRKRNLNGGAGTQYNWECLYTNK